MKENRSFQKDFFLVVIGQIVSLFGNAVIRFALPVHLLYVTGSAAVLGVISGVAFVPLILMSPLGGLAADRINKRNIMVGLDFFTAFLTAAFIAAYGAVDIVALTLILLFFLYGISGAYQPSVQASIPALVPADQVVRANAVINMVSSLSGLLGPALGGVAYAAWGIRSVLTVCTVCFICSAVMEVFIHIPFEKRKRELSLFGEMKADLRESAAYIVKLNPAVGKLTLSCAFVNFALSSLLIIGFPVVVMQELSFPSSENPAELYGFLEALLAVGGLGGGLAVGIFPNRLKLSGGFSPLLIAGLLLLPVAGALLFCGSYAAYGVMAASGLLIMAMASIYTIQIMAYIQTTTPRRLIGKVISCVTALSICSQPLGQMTYGFLFERCNGAAWLIFLVASLAAVAAAAVNRKIVLD